MAAKPTTEAIAASLMVSERVLLFCIASDTDWPNAGITGATARTMQVKNLIERDRAATRYALTDQRRAVPGALVAAR
jgi:hypothetical protein